MTTELKVAETPAEVAQAMTDFARFMNAQPVRRPFTYDELFGAREEVEEDEESDLDHHGLLGSELI